ncbi:actin binding protein [Aspergillus nomiae NRRL 13137]|uniref:Actin binding protein n=1 Tax=Aspergillus nomiae NRRL (strain ATCC 15546 / NRRL 13137 / CBS 260.88 / M93) TaxID=1509407 RepID=A0A0L1IWV7_ASPN3|nr:actin binding protein [Aspergillus nomiae NRRL 13137]KNG84036.1 actin binding protein [Aspergillus nomiae NRRL 13137]
MASLNLSSNGPSIAKSYQAVVNSPPPTSSSSPTYGQWAVFSVSAPLVSAFQQDTGNKESVLKVQSTGDGELADLIDEFSEGKMQFAFVKVTDPNTGLPKSVLLAWCGEGVPERTKGYFTSHLSAVSKLLHGYHVQITARADGDLTAEGIIQKVGDASGAKYSAGAGQLAAAAPKPPIASKPVFTPSRTGGIGSNATAAAPQKPLQRYTDNDGWGPDAPPITRTELEKVQPAYQPTKVNIQALRSEESHVANMQVQYTAEDRSDVVKGGYQPVGKVDIAAIRRQAREAGELKDDRPEPVRGAYEPVGKIDIAAIRARAQKPSESMADDVKFAAPNHSQGQAESGNHAIPPPGQSERLTSLPKPKVANKFGANQSFVGTKPPLPSGSVSKPTPAAVPVGSASRTFADEGGKTPAQLWAERKARERGQATASDLPSSGYDEPSLQTQHSGRGEWKSSYSGRTWTPVQTTHTGKSLTSNTSHQATDPAANDDTETEPQAPKSVNALRDQFADKSLDDSAPEARPDEQLDIGRSVPLPGLPTGPVQPETTQEPQVRQVTPSPPEQPRSPTPPTPPVRETSPIRVAMPVGRGAADIHDEQPSPPSVLPTDSLRQTVPKDADLADDTQDVARATAEATVGNNFQTNGIQAVVQYDYERAEDNEIELTEGEYVTEIEMVDKDWWLGSNARGERGLFPSNYVELLEDKPQNSTLPALHDHNLDTGIQEPQVEAAAPSVLSSANGPTATALYDYEAAEDNELSFPEGAEITHIEFPDDDWWFGKYGNKEGLFPANYVQLRK